jgi:hypothetical protein
VAKIEMAFALGLLKEETRGALRLVGKIRNRFAHEFRRVRFSDVEIAKLCDQLKEFDKGMDLMTNESDPMKLYGTTCFLCMAVLFATGQVILIGRDGQSQPVPATSPEKSG